MPETKLARQRTATIILPEGYKDAAEFAADCGVELADATTRWVEWAEGIRVSEADLAALRDDLAVFGNAYVETIGEGHGRRIAPQDFHMRAADGERAGESKDGR